VEGEEEDGCLYAYTGKKENKIFLIYKGNSDWIGCKVIYEERLPNI
jgi:hypothetical protein